MLLLCGLWPSLSVGPALRCCSDSWKSMKACSLHFSSSTSRALAFSSSSWRSSARIRALASSSIPARLDPPPRSGATFVLLCVNGSEMEPAGFAVQQGTPKEQRSRESASTGELDCKGCRCKGHASAVSFSVSATQTSQERKPSEKKRAGHSLMMVPPRQLRQLQQLVLLQLFLVLVPGARGSLDSNSCFSYGCDDARTFAFAGPLDVNMGTLTLSWAKPHLASSGASLLCTSTSLDLAVCTVQRAEASAEAEGDAEAKAATGVLDSGSSSSAGGAISVLAWTSAGESRWNLSVLDPLSSYAYLDVLGNSVLCNGLLLASVDQDGNLRSRPISVVPNVDVIQSPVVTANDVIMFSSLSGTVFGYLTNGVPHASIWLNDTVDGQPGSFLPITAPIGSDEDSLVFVLTRFTPSSGGESSSGGGLCRLYAIAVMRTIDQRLLVLWHFDYNCTSTSTSTNGATIPSPFITAAGVLVFVEGDAVSGRPLALIGLDASDTQNVLFRTLLPTSPPTSIRAMAYAASSEWIIAALETDETGLTVFSADSGNFVKRLGLPSQLRLAPSAPVWATVVASGMRDVAVSFAVDTNSSSSSGGGSGSNSNCLRIVALDTITEEMLLGPPLVCGFNATEAHHLQIVPVAIGSPPQPLTLIAVVDASVFGLKVAV
jgi:hypothetical protein